MYFIILRYILGDSIPDKDVASSSETVSLSTYILHVILHLFEELEVVQNRTYNIIEH